MSPDEVARVPGLELGPRTVAGTTLLALLARQRAPLMEIAVRAVIGNAVATTRSGRTTTDEWKRAVCLAAHAKRGKDPWSAAHVYAVTAGFRFHLRTHGNQRLDVENFMKPTLDGLAAGLFMPPAQDPHSVAWYDFDDSGFRHLLVHRLEDAADRGQESVVLVIADVG